MELFKRYPPGDPNVRVLVVEGYSGMQHLGGLPSPALIDLCSDGKPHEAWCSDGYWRARDDRWDAAHKPADTDYILVRVGLNPRAED